MGIRWRGRLPGFGKPYPGAGAGHLEGNNSKMIQLDCGACLIGRRTLKRVSPGLDWNSISPPCRFATMRLLITSPRPVPDPTPLVV